MGSFSVSTRYRHPLLPAAMLSLGLLLPTLAPAQVAEALLVDAARADVVGTRAPDFVLQTLEGDTIDLGALYGEKAVYLKFWATWCIPCRQQMPHFEGVYQDSGDDLAVIGINAGFNETLADIQDFREEYGIHMPIVVDDGTLAGAFNLRITPQHVVIGKDGTIQYMGQEAGAELEAALERARTAPVQEVSANAAVADGPQFEVGDVVPAESLATSDGGSFDLVDAEARAGSVLVFMLPWCESYLADTRPAAAAGCRQVREQVEALRAEHGELRWVGINSGLWTMPGDLQSYARQYGTSLPLALDTDSHLFRAFDITSAPTVIVTDASGSIVKRIEGYDPALNEVLSAL
jgi:peroxiredoxin